MKAIQDSILEYLDNEDNNEQYFDDLRSLLNFQQSQFDIHELKSILCLISNISKYHHRKSFFFDKIKQIILLLKKEIKQAFSNADIFNIFKDSNRVLLLLFDENILTLDSNLSTTIDKNYFQPEINKLNPDSSPIELPEFFYEKRLQGENDSYLCELVRNDNIKDFIIHYNKQEISLSMTIQSSIYETNSFLINQNPTLIEYSAFFGSIQILRFLYQNQVELTSSLWIYSIHGHNPEIIHFLEENQIQPSDGTYQECLKESIKCHHNDFALYFINNFIPDDFDIHLNYYKNDIYYSFLFYNFQFIPIELNEHFCFFYAIDFGNSELFQYYKNIQDLNINALIILIYIFSDLISIFFNLNRI